jgi:hypothetical protein
LTAAQSAGCSITDYACQCGSAKNAITASATPCVLKGCSTSDATSKLFSPSSLVLQNDA